MNRASITLASALLVGAIWPAHAGPDWQVIEQGRRAKQALHSRGIGGESTAKCSPEALALPPDHGPRAQTTPRQNERRRQEQAKACPNPRT